MELLGITGTVLQGCVGGWKVIPDESPDGDEVQEHLDDVDGCCLVGCLDLQTDAVQQ